MIPDADRRTACVSSQVGCPVGCTLLRQRHQRRQRQSLSRPDRRANLRPQHLLQSRNEAHHQRRLHGHGRAPGQLRRRDDSHPHPARSRLPSTSATAASPSPPSASPPKCASWPTKAIPSIWRFPCTPPTKHCASSSFPGPSISPSTTSSTPPAITSSRPAAKSRSNTFSCPA